MPKGNLPKMKTSLCNTPITEDFGTCESLSTPADISGLVIVKLKCKVEYRSCVLFEPVIPVFVKKFLNFPRSHNPFYLDIEINVNNTNLNFRNQNRSDLSTNNDSDSILLELLRLQNEPIKIMHERKYDNELQESAGSSTSRGVERGHDNADY